VGTQGHPPIHRLIDAYYCLLCFVRGGGQSKAKQSQAELNGEAQETRLQLCPTILIRHCPGCVSVIMITMMMCWCDYVLGFLLDQALHSYIHF
ncbi:hypothetical protein M5D96_009409, partial [Drosophila gunungcola]